VIFSRNGKDLTRRFPDIRDSIVSLPAQSVTIDAEIVVCDDDGKPDFKALMEGAAEGLCAWCFDLMELNGRDVRERSLVERKALLHHLLNKADDHVLRYSGVFSDAEKLLAVANKEGLGGDRLEARRSAVPLGQEPRMDQGQVPSVARSE
jgi:bifunctional non-homologous end joining protein LigD